MAEKANQKPKDTTPEFVKNTQTGVKDKNEISLRWYHVAATAIVLALVVMAIIRIISRFDMSIINSEYTVKYATGCTTTIAGPIKTEELTYRYTGVKEGDMLGPDGPTSDESDAYVKIVELGSNKVKIKTRDAVNGVWSEKEIRYGEITTTITEEAPDCMPGVTYIIEH